MGMRVSSSFVQLALGIDNLPVFEEIFGQAIAHEIADAIETRVRQTIPHLCTYRRTAQNQFLVGLPDHRQAGALALVDRMQGIVASDVVDTRAGPVAATLSAGCAVRTQDMGDHNDLEPQAIQALHLALRTGVGSVNVATDDGALLRYREDMMRTSRATLGAVKDERLTIAFQPVVRSSGGNTISFHECLARIRQDDGTVIAAGAFMPVIEQLGMAALIDRQVLKMAIDALIRHPCARLSINIFPQTMQDRAWLERFHLFMRHIQRL